MRRLRRGLALLLLVVGALAAVSCGVSPNRVLVSANDLQDAAAHAYDQAKAEEYDAGTRCARAVPAPSLEACRAAGIPIPYDPVRLAELAGPINAAYEAIRAAAAVKDAVTAGTKPSSDLATALLAVGRAIAHLYAAAADLGIALDQPAAAKLVQEAGR